MKNWKDWFRKESAGVEYLEDAADMPLIRIVDVKKAYQVEAGTFYALRGVNLTVEKGEFLSIIGKSGSGKSTLINMLTGIDRPSEGEVWVGGVGIHGLTENQLAIWRGRHVGIVFQFFQLLPTLSVVENVMLPMDFCDCFSPLERRERAMELLRIVGLEDQAGKLPTALSGGQQQRAAIARSLANDPAMLVADEPTGNLDSATADAVFSLFTDLASRGRTIVMVTHDPDLAKRAGRTVVVADGQIVGDE